MDAAARLKLVCIAATGMNNVDLTYAKERGIQVKNVADYSTESVVQTTFTTLLYLLNKPTYYDQYVKSGAYSKNQAFTHIAGSFWQLHGKQLGIIGMGNIGRRVADVAKAFGCEVVYYSTSGKNTAQAYPRMELEELLATSDVVSVHAPLNEKTKDLITQKELSCMQPHAYLLNMGRGGIINEEALAQAINENRIAGAGTDVFSYEPIKEDNPLLQVKNKEKLCLLPHIAWASVEARNLLVNKIEGHIQQFLRE
jgi:lactate dehydrogenase-like 2-hydroxyacid dehydrogenase